MHTRFEVIPRNSAGPQRYPAVWWLFQKALAIPHDQWPDLPEPAVPKPIPNGNDARQSIGECYVISLWPVTHPELISRAVRLVSRSWSHRRCADLFARCGIAGVQPFAAVVQSTPARMMKTGSPGEELRIIATNKRLCVGRPTIALESRRAQEVRCQFLKQATRLFKMRTGHPVMKLVFNAR
jgi:hypothetical protein